MALNVELPLTTNELFEENENDLQYSVDLCRENLKILVSPGSESSGVSSLDAEEAKKLATEQLTTTPIIAPEATSVQTNIEQPEEKEKEDEPEEQQTFLEPDKDYSLEYVKVMYNGRDILDIASNINASWNIQYTYLPDNNFAMYWPNRSQYHRLGDSYNTREYSLEICRRCYFQYPVKYEEPINTTNTEDILPCVTIYPDNHHLTNKLANNNTNNYNRPNMLSYRSSQTSVLHDLAIANYYNLNLRPQTPSGNLSNGNTITNNALNIPCPTSANNNLNMGHTTMGNTSGIGSTRSLQPSGMSGNCNVNYSGNTANSNMGNMNFNNPMMTNNNNINNNNNNNMFNTGIGNMGNGAGISKHYPNMNRSNYNNQSYMGYNNNHSKMPCKMYSHF